MNWMVWLLALLPTWTWASAGSGSMISNVGLCVVMAGAFALLVRRIGLPPILGYLLAGVALGPLGLQWITDSKEIHTISEFGLILLLFMIGLEMDLKKMAAAGKWVILPGVLQFPLSVVLVVVGLWAMPILPHFLQGGFAWGYLAFALSLSSTMIVVKILYESKEINSLAGRIALGILIFQDIWAILGLALQPELNNPQISGLLATAGAGFALVAVALLLSRYALPILFRSVDNQPEIILILSLGWCFLVSLVAASPVVGLSMEMGALIAGVALGTFPYNHDVTARAVSLRDFFITLFFVALGMQIAYVDVRIVALALCLSLLVIPLRLATVYLPLQALRAPVRAGLEASIQLAQMSEFSLVILAIGVGFGHVDPQLLTLAVWIFAFGATFSGVIGQNHTKLQSYLQRLVRKAGIPDDQRLDKAPLVDLHYDVLFLGFGRIGRAFLEEMRWHDPELCQRVGVVDYNMKSRGWLEEVGAHFHYGDIAHPVTFQSLADVTAKVVVSGIPDSWLKGTSNTQLLKRMQEQFPDAYHVINTSSLEKAETLYARGAHHVLIPEQMAGHALADQVRLALSVRSDRK